MQPTSETYKRILLNSNHWFETTVVIGESGATDGGIRIIPCSVSSSRSTNNYQPTPLAGEAADKLLAKILKLSDIGGPLWLEDEQTP